MSYEDEDQQDNDQANGANGRFDNLDRRFKAGGNPRRLEPGKAEELTAAMTVVGGFYRGTLLPINPQALNSQGDLTGPLATPDLMREFKAAKDAKEAADFIAKELGRQYDYLRLAVVPERFDAEGIKNIKVEGVGRVQLAGDLHAGIIKGKEEAAFEFLDDNGRGDVVKKTVNSSSLKAILKKMMEKGEEFPDDVFKAEPFTRASIVKA